MKKINLRILSAVTAVSLVMSLCTSGLSTFAADDDYGTNTADVSQSYPDEYTTVIISSVEDFEEFAQNCHYDSWSVDKAVVLTADLDFTGLEFTPVAVFAGTFDGQGYTISGISITGYASETGVFGTIQNTGTVTNLNVEADIEPDGYPDTIGGIAGYNYGIISNCTFTGSITADSESGGIVGHNGQVGMIVGCSSSGSINVSSGCGGIAGYNEGSIISCTNEMEVNTVYQDTTPSLDDLDNALDEVLQSGSLLNTGSLSSDSDIGGIAGFNSGAVTSCTNYGTVGYEHVGYNVGGIAGRSSGYISGCTNYGTVYGRKDVGGIAGQLQPYMLISYSEESLDELEDELDTLIDLIDAAMDSAGSYSDSMSEHLSTISGLAEDAKDAAESLAESMEESVDAAVTDFNEAISRLLAAVSEFDASSYLSEMEQTLDDLLDSLEEGSTDLFNFESDSDDDDTPEDGGTDDDDTSEDGGTDDDDTSKDGGTNDDDTSEDGDTDDDDTSDNDGTDDSEGDGGTDLNDGSSEESTDSEETSAGSAVQALDIVYTSTGTTYQDILASVEIQLGGISDEMRDSSDTLFESISGILEELEEMSDDIGSLSDSAQDDIQAVIDQLDVVTDTMIDSAESFADTMISDDDEEMVEDTSDADYEGTYSGRTTGCVNYGGVEADVNTGGVVGIINVEYSLDPELDIETSGSTTWDYIFQEKCIVDNCVNYGTITTKSTYTGGIAGHMEMGLVADCENYGILDCSGKYVGGITGYSVGTVRSSAAKCALSGSSYVGGIAGYGTTLYDNISMVEIYDYENYAGAIAGAVYNVDVSDVYENYYYSNTVYGIDAASYAGIAEGVTYAELMELDGIPDTFDDMVLSFYADDVLVGVLTCAYGEGIDESELPEIPEKDGFYGVWSRDDYSCIITDESVTAEYIRYTTLLSSEQTRDGGLPVIEVDGMFRDEDALTVTAGDIDETEEYEVERWTVLIPDDGQQTHQIRLLVPDDVIGGTVYILEDGVKTEVETEDFGGYFVFEAEGNEVTIVLDDTMTDSVQGKIKMGLLIAGCAAVLAIILVAAARLIRKKRRAKKQPDAAPKKPQERPEEQSEERPEGPTEKQSEERPEEQAGEPQKEQP